MHNISEDEDFIGSTIRDVDGYLAGEREAQRREIMHDPTYQQWSREIAEENDREQERYWAEHCPEHGTELGEEGFCALCVQEERRNDA